MISADSLMIDLIGRDLGGEDVFRIKIRDTTFTFTGCVRRDQLENELMVMVNDGTLTDWIVDTVKDAVKNRWELGMISDDEKNITMAALEATRI